MVGDDNGTLVIGGCDGCFNTEIPQLMTVYPNEYMLSLLAFLGADSEPADIGPGYRISGFAGFNMQKAFLANYADCTDAFHQTTVGKVAQVGSLIALTPLNTDYRANWFETLSFGSLKAAFVGGRKAGSKMVGEAVEGAIGVVATPFLISATGVDAGGSTLCAGNAVQASIPVPH